MHIVDVNGNEVQKLPLEKALTSCGLPSWSPDGNYLVFHCTDTSISRASGIYKIKTDGTELECLSCSATSYDDYWPVWSPDDLSIAFTRASKVSFILYSMNTDGTIQRPLLGNNSKSGGHFLAWSANKEWVFITSSEGGPPYLVKVDGTQSFKIKKIPEDAIVTDWTP